MTSGELHCLLTQVASVSESGVVAMFPTDVAFELNGQRNESSGLSICFLENLRRGADHHGPQ